jgi:hypothetical protein
MQVLDIRAAALCGLGAKGFTSSLKQLGLPLHDRIRVNVEALRKLGDGLIALDRCDRHLRFEGRRVVSAGTAHDDLLLSRGFFAPQRGKSSHNDQSSFPGPPLTSDFKDKHEAKENHHEDVKHISALQDIVYADQRYALLIIFQGMDAPGKDGAIRSDI